MTTEQTEAQAKADLSAKIASTVDAYVDLVANGTAEQVVGLFADGATVEDPVGTEVRDTREQLLEFYGVVTGMDERTATVNFVRIAGDTAVFEFTLVTKTSGMAFEVTPIDIMRFDADGRITSMRAVWEPSDLKQL